MEEIWPTTWDVLYPCKSWNIHPPQRVFSPDFWTINRIFSNKNLYYKQTQHKDINVLTVINSICPQKGKISFDFVFPKPLNNYSPKNPDPSRSSRIDGLNPILTIGL